MHPILFTVGNIPVTAYDMALSLAFGIGILVVRPFATSTGPTDVPR